VANVTVTGSLASFAEAGGLQIAQSLLNALVANIEARLTSAALSADPNSHEQADALQRPVSTGAAAAKLSLWKMVAQWISRWRLVKRGTV